MLDATRRESLIAAISADRLIWFPERGLGFYPVAAPAAEVYDRGYFERYRRQADTPIGRALMEFRVGFVQRHYSSNAPIVDVGIGSGAFIEARNGRFQRSTFGFDINPAGAQWLVDRGLFLNPNVAKVPAVTLWDVLEHIEDFRPLLANVMEWCFVSIPIFDGVEHVLRSKHYRKDEHYWYFTDGAFIEVMADQGFRLEDASDEESKIGRDGIRTYAFERC